MLRTFFRGGRLVAIPTQQSKKLVVLDRLAQEFEVGRRFAEREVNAVLRRFHDDVAALRRYLVDEGFLDRDAGEYWRSGGRTARSTDRPSSPARLAPALRLRSYGRRRGPRRIAVAPRRHAARGSPTPSSPAAASSVEPDDADALVWADHADPDGLGRRPRRPTPGCGGCSCRGRASSRTSRSSRAHPDRTWTCGKGVYAEPVAELALTLLLAGLRRPRRVRAGRRRGADRSGGTSSAPVSSSLGGGGITESLLRLLEPFGADVTVVRRDARADAPAPPGSSAPTSSTPPSTAPTPLVLALALTPETDGADRPGPPRPPRRPRLGRQRRPWPPHRHRRPRRRPARRRHRRRRPRRHRARAAAGRATRCGRFPNVHHHAARRQHARDGRAAAVGADHRERPPVAAGQDAARSRSTSRPGTDAPEAHALRDPRASPTARRASEVRAAPTSPSPGACTPTGGSTLRPRSGPTPNAACRRSTRRGAVLGNPGRRGRLRGRAAAPAEPAPRPAARGGRLLDRRRCSRPRTRAARRRRPGSSGRCRGCCSPSCSARSSSSPPTPRPTRRDARRRASCIVRRGRHRRTGAVRHRGRPDRRHRGRRGRPVPAGTEPYQPADRNVALCLLP